MNTLSRLPRQLGSFIRNGLLEALRNKVLYAVLIAGAIAIAAASAFGALSLHQEERLFNNLVYFVGFLFLVALAIYQGTSSLHREVSTKTIYTVLSKPVDRPVFLVGKYVASAVVLAVAACLIFGMKIAVALYLGYDVTAVHFSAYFTAILQLVIIVALAHFFGSFSGPLLSALFTFCVFLMGSLTPQIEDAARQFRRQENPVHLLLEGSLWVLPDLEKLNLSYELTHQIEVSAAYLGHAVVYTSTVVFFLLLFSHLIFRRRDLG